MKKRALSILLCACMTLALLPAAAFLGGCHNNPASAPSAAPAPTAASAAEHAATPAPVYIEAASPAFSLGPWGRLSDDPDEVIEGRQSLAGKYNGSSEYNKILGTNPGILPLHAGGTYTLSFRYKILETPDRGFDVIFYSPTGAAADVWLPPKVYTGEAGDQGEVMLTSTLEAYEDYQIFWNIVGKGAVAIDSISVHEEPDGACVAALDFEQPPYAFPGLRTDYRLDITAAGTAVVDSGSGETTVVPFGERMYFKGEPKYSKDTGDMIHHVRSQMEVHGDWEDLEGLPVDWLRTDGGWTWDGRSAWNCIDARFDTPWHFPDQPDKVITGYVDFCEVFPVDWDPAYNPAWDKDGDLYIDDGVAVPDYIAVDTINPRFGIYMANYWTDSWLEQLKKKVDLIAAQHFDGVFFDVLPAHATWLLVHPEMDDALLKQREIDLLSKISAYAKQRYGASFLVTGNIGANAHEYFHNLGDYLDGGYYQAFFFNFLGTAEINQYVGTAEADMLNFLRDQGLQVLTFENVGTGTSNAEDMQNYDEDMSRNYDDAITRENLMPIFFWAAKSGVTPYVTTNFMFDSFANGMFPRISRIIPGRPPFSDTPYDDWALGSEGDDVFATGAGDDMAYGGDGDDEIDGGDGDDAACYRGPRKDYDVARVGRHVIVTARMGGEGRDVLTGIERLIFSDTTEAAP